MKRLMLCVLLASCGSESTEKAPVTIDQFDQTCVSDGECTQVWLDPCTCGCTAVVNTAAVSEVAAATEGITCEGGIPSCAPCEEVPACVARQCTVRTPVILAAEDFGSDCATDDDCVAISEGDTCAPCQCPSVAVNRADYEARTYPECTNHQNVTCNNCPEAQVTCEAGVCVASWD